MKRTTDWDLVEFDYDLDTGLATLSFERLNEGVRETKQLVRPEPTNPSHVDWSKR